MYIDFALVPMYNIAIVKQDKTQENKEKERLVFNMMTLAELEKVVAEYREMKALLTETEEVVKSLERDIIGYLDDNKKLSETGSDFTVKVSTCERRTVDTKRLEADLGSLAEYQRLTQYRRLYVK